MSGGRKDEIEAAWEVLWWVPILGYDVDQETKKLLVNHNEVLSTLTPDIIPAIMEVWDMMIVAGEIFFRNAISSGVALHYFDHVYLQRQIDCRSAARCTTGGNCLVGVFSYYVLRINIRHSAIWD